MNYPVLSGDIIYIASDITAGLFLIVLIGSITVQSERRPEPGHLLAAAILELTGIFARIVAGTVETVPDGFAWQPSVHILPSVPVAMIWILSFLFITLGIEEAAAYVIYVNGSKSKSSLRTRLAAGGIILAAGTVLYICTESINALTIANLALFAFCFFHIYICCSVSVMRKFRRASLPAIITLVIPFFFEHVRLTGLGFSMMLLILNEQYLGHIERELAENEAELAKGRMQLLAEQISSHYIYNSLQSIRNLCDSDSAKARNAIDSFSEYLRGNLESLTAEELIPFSRELELTQAYLELEKLTGRGTFEDKYELDTTDFMLPLLVLQPVVENAVKHGVYGAAPGVSRGKTGVTEIIIATRDLGGYICIEVTDRTEGRDAAAAEAVLAGANTGQRIEASETARNRTKRKSVGLENVRTRLAIQSGGTLEMESTDSGTKVTIILPVSQDLNKL